MELPNSSRDYGDLVLHLPRPTDGTGVPLKFKIQKMQKQKKVMSKRKLKMKKWKSKWKSIATF